MNLRVRVENVMESKYLHNYCTVLNETVGHLATTYWIWEDILALFCQELLILSFPEVISGHTGKNTREPRKKDFMSSETSKRGQNFIP